MVLRFEMSSPSGKRSLLQYMVPWLQNVELVEDAPASQPPGIVVQPSEHVPEPVVESIGNSVLTGSGWGSPEGTKVVLHNLLYITTKVCCCNPLIPHLFTPITPLYTYSMEMSTLRRWRTCGVPFVLGCATFV